MLELPVSRARPGFNYNGPGRAGLTKQKRVTGPGRAQMLSGRAEKYRPVQTSSTVVHPGNLVLGCQVTQASAGGCRANPVR